MGSPGAVLTGEAMVWGDQQSTNSYIPESVRISGVYMCERNSVLILYISVFKTNTVYIC